MYIENRIKNMVDKLVKKQGTTNPEELIKSRKNITFEYIALSDNVKGLYQYFSAKEQILGVNDDLWGYDNEFTLFHELGHSMLGHQGEMVLNHFSVRVTKEEHHADLFSTYCMVVRYNITKENVNDFPLPERAMKLIHKFL